jgi:hypothetical protein
MPSNSNSFDIIYEANGTYLIVIKVLEVADYLLSSQLRASEALLRG